MKLTQRRIRWLLRLVLVAVLFAQATLAAHACVSPQASAAHALAMQAGNVAMSCHHQAEESNANACLMHCTQSDQVNLDQPQMAIMTVDAAVLRVAMPQLQHQVLAVLRPPLVLNTGPPLAIRFCSFLI